VHPHLSAAGAAHHPCPHLRGSGSGVPYTFHPHSPITGAPPAAPQQLCPASVCLLCTGPSARRSYAQQLLARTWQLHWLQKALVLWGEARLPEAANMAVGLRVPNCQASLQLAPELVVYCLQMGLLHPPVCMQPGALNNTLWYAQLSVPHPAFPPAVACVQWIPPHERARAVSLTTSGQWQALQCWIQAPASCISNSRMSVTVSCCGVAAGCIAYGPAWQNCPAVHAGESAFEAGPYQLRCLISGDGKETHALIFEQSAPSSVQAAMLPSVQGLVSLSCHMHSSTALRCDVCWEE
jgi:hypothetical protein